MKLGNCIDCIFWDRESELSDDEHLGLCRKQSPLVTGGMMSNVETVWPTVNSGDWCGDFDVP